MDWQETVLFAREMRAAAVSRAAFVVADAALLKGALRNMANAGRAAHSASALVDAEDVGRYAGRLMGEVLALVDDGCDWRDVRALIDGRYS